MPSRAMKMLEMSPLMSATGNEGGELMLNHNSYDMLSKTLQMPTGAPNAPKAPSSTNDGVIFGQLMHQGKFAGAWKKGYFVLKGSYLFQYKKASDSHPKKAFYVSYAFTEKSSAESLAEEAGAKYINKIEEKACSLRINVFTPDKLKVLTAPSEETMNQWTEKLMESVKEACSARPGILEAKEEAAEKIKPLMMAQAYSEVDKFQKLIKSLEKSGLLPEEEDPRHSDEVAKAGKMKMLKSTMDENVWTKYYYVLVGKTVYYYKSRKKHDRANYDDKEEDEEEDDEDHNEMPWKGCFNVTVATVGAAPSSVSSKAKVFQIKTPLRTFILKARHELDAEDWMSQICAAQQGIPTERREAKFRGFDPYADRLADKLKADPGQIRLTDVLHHPVGVRYFSQYLSMTDPSLAKGVKAFKSIEKYRSKVVPERKAKKALKIFKKYISKSEIIPKQVQNDLASQVEHFDFAAANMFQPAEDLLLAACEDKFGGFKDSPMFDTLLKSCGPKMVTIVREKGGTKSYKLDGTIIVGRSRENESGDGYIHLEEDHKVSREHCKIDAGPLSVLVTDLGSSKGTKLDSKDGKKIMSKVILPGQSLYIGSYVLTYGLGEAPAAKGKSKGGFMSKMFGKKK